VSHPTITEPPATGITAAEPRASFPGTKPRMLLIVNPFATTVSARMKNLVVYALRGRYDIEAVETQRRNHATDLTREAVGEGFDLVVAFGGDGTLNEAANGLAGSNLPLSVLPGGCTNVVCRMLGIPTEEIAIDWNKVVFNMLTIKGIYGREMYETWYKMTVMIQSGLDISPVITHRFPANEFERGFDVMKSGESGKVILDWKAF